MPLSPTRSDPAGLAPAPSRPSTQAWAGAVAIGAALLFLADLVIEYRYGLFPGQNPGAASTANQIGFTLALLGWAVALVLLLRARLAARGRFATVAIIILTVGLLALVTANLTTLGSGTQDSLLYPIGGLAQLLGVVLTGIALARKDRLHSWDRLAAVLFALAYLALFAATFLVLDGEPTFAVEMLFPLSWITLGAALIHDSRRHTP
jgi:hypothetical protein